MSTKMDAGEMRRCASIDDAFVIEHTAEILKGSDVDALEAVLYVQSRAGLFDQMTKTVDALEKAIPAKKNVMAPFYRAMTIKDTVERATALEALTTCRDALREAILITTDAELRMQKLSDYLVIQSDDTIAWAEMAAAYRKHDRHDEERFCYQQILLANPKSWSAALGIARVAKGEDAASYALLARRLCPDKTCEPVIKALKAAARKAGGATEKKLLKLAQKE